MILQWKRFYGDNLGKKTASYCIAMRMPHVDKINEARDNVWEVHFLSLEVVRSIDVPVMNEAAIEDFENWSDDEPTVSSTQESIQEMSSGKMNSLLSRLCEPLNSRSVRTWSVSFKVIAIYSTFKVIILQRQGIQIARNRKRDFTRR